MNTQVAAILLAAGESRRMGKENKLFLEVKGEPMILRAIRSLLTAGVDELVIVLNPENDLLLDSFSLRGVVRVINPDHRKGMTTSIQKGVAACGADVAGYMICMSDQPFLEAGEYDHLLDEFRTIIEKDPAAIAVPYFQEKKGNPVIFSSAYRESILTHEEMEGCRGIIMDNASHVHRVEMPSGAIHRDIDTPDDYRSIS